VLGASLAQSGRDAHPRRPAKDLGCPD
jgi:hypothetical protein